MSRTFITGDRTTASLPAPALGEFRSIGRIAHARFWSEAGMPKKALAFAPRPSQLSSKYTAVSIADLRSTKQIRREPYLGTVVTAPTGVPRVSLKRTSGISASTFRSITDCAAHVMRSACLIQRRRSGHDRVGNWIMRVLVSPQQYRDFAEQCLRWAASAKREEHKNTMLQMAKQWFQRADELERTGTSFRREPSMPPEDDAQQG